MKMIEVTFDGERMLLNTDKIVAVIPDQDPNNSKAQTRVLTTQGQMRIEESYDDLKKWIEEAE